MCVNRDMISNVINWMILKQMDLADGCARTRSTSDRVSRKKLF